MGGDQVLKKHYPILNNFGVELAATFFSGALMAWSFWYYFS